MIEIKDISKSYKLTDSKLLIIDELNLSINQGQTVAITGTSGAGKSTFLSLLAGFESCDSGSIIVDGNDINTMNEKDLVNFRATKLGFVFQNFYLLPHINVLENVCLPLDILGYDGNKAIQEATNLLKKVGLEKSLNKLPSKLSGGEQQRVAICRAIISKPKIIFADEPTGNLDFKTTDLICDLLFSLVKEHNITMLIVTHNLDLAKKCDKSYILEKGKLV